AGAHWRSYADIADLEQQELDAATYRHFAHLAKTDPRAGVMFLTGHDYWDVKPKDFVDPWFKSLLDNYRYIPTSELPPGTEFGICYTTVSVNAPKYLLYLQEQVLARGGIIKRGTVSSLKELAQIPHGTSTADVIVNCSGLGSRNLGGVLDHQMYPTRGQIVIVKVEDKLWPKAKEFTTERYAEGSAMGKGTITYVIPRQSENAEGGQSGEIVLGGTMENWNYQDTTSEETSKAILQRVVATRPDLFSTATVLKSCAGLRPNRRGGVRVSAAIEQLDWNEGWEQPVVVMAHNYGHAGFGYQASIGCAEKVVAQIEKCVRELGHVRASTKTMAKL
ncbi:hypothetical protein BGZ83_008619, partial [Gryganskiella cystojenkinii]